jgi:hypothetical protein
MFALSPSSQTPLAPDHDKETAMSMRNVLISSQAKGAVLALIAAAALSATLPSVATAAPASTAQLATSVSDFSAARRHHQARRTAPRDAFGSIAGGAATYGAPASQGYGYGSGDNSRGQTW